MTLLPHRVTTVPPCRKSHKMMA